ncbi:FUSC family protein [Xanthobacter sp. TB0136]|uniref:FUSC family protein n=1 Tax=Xanthobacter sp. TB0136 TaxID=3459177 RepID=UPI004039CC46
MEQTAESPLRLMVRQTLEDLKPFPLRFAMTWRVAAVCALVSGIAMMYHIPESAISCYLVIFLMKSDGTQNIIVPLVAAFLITLVVAMLLGVVMVTIESPLLRVLAMAFFSFIFLFIGAASKLGEAGGVVGLIFAFMLTLLDLVPVGKLVSEGLRYAWEMAVMPLVVTAAFSLVFGPSTLSVLRVTMTERLGAAWAALAGRPEKLNDLLLEGNDDGVKGALLTRVFHLAPAPAIAQIETDVQASYKVMLAAGAMPQNTPPAERAALAADLERAGRALEAGQPVPMPVSAPGSGHAERALRNALAEMAGDNRKPFKPAPAEPFFAPDALTNPAYQQFALKITLAAISCYIFYTAIAWDGIHTAMITCYVAALGTTGETIHKLALRIGGCLIGASLGFGSILLFMPYMDEVWQLMLLIFLATLVAAWVSTGPERISYAGVQIGLAFFLTLLQGFSPSTSMDSGWDRIVGILVGNVAVYLVSTLIRPAPLAGTVRQNLAKALEGAARLARTAPDERTMHVAQAAQVEKLVGQVKYQIFLLPFEPARIQLAPREKLNLGKMAGQLAMLNREIFLSSEDLSGLATRLENLARNVRRPHSGSSDLEETTVPGGEDDAAASGRMLRRMGHMEALGAGGL